MLPVVRKQGGVLRGTRPKGLPEEKRFIEISQKTLAQLGLVMHAVQRRVAGQFRAIAERRAMPVLLIAPAVRQPGRWLWRQRYAACARWC